MKDNTLINLPENQEIVADTILVFSPTGQINLFADFQSYLDYVNDRENHDDLN